MSDLTRGATYTTSIPTAAQAHALVDSAVINKEFITDKTSVTAAAADSLVIADASDSNALKKVTVTSLGASTIDSYSGATGSAILAAGSVGGVHTILGISSFGSTLIDDATAGSARVTLGLGGDNFPINNYSIYTSSGSFVKASLPAGVNYVVIEVQGGGGAGGGCPATGAGSFCGGGGGGAGGYAMKRLAGSVLAAEVTILVGAGGTGVTGSAGTAAGSSAFGSVVIGFGGGTGSVGVSGAAGATVGAAGGSATGGDINCVGGDGGCASFSVGASMFISGYGGTSHYGGGGRSSSGDSIGVAGYNYGGGGAGAASNASQSARAGGNGGGGLVIVRW